ncbi:MAG: ABC transporter ATP-binding protein [Arachnia sp.]
MPEPLIASDVVVRFGRTDALSGLSLTARAGMVTALLGPNGAGKTTFVRCCTGLVGPDEGSITVLGHRPGSHEVQARVGLMPQHTGAWAAIGARQLLGYLASLYAHPHDVNELMALLGIDDYPATAFRNLSGGQQQTVNLAGALIGRPELLFLDEPTAGLDVRATRATWEVIRQVRDAGAAIVLTTHDMREATELADAVSIIDRGQVRATGTVADFTRDGRSLEAAYLEATEADR